MSNKLAKRGFTLIELLVVVLIIGILAAVAFPQYNKAVWKTRIMGDAGVLSRIIQAQDLYYIENGTRAFTLAELDIDLPCQSRVVLPDGEYCGLNGSRATATHLIKAYNHAGIYIQDRSKYILEYTYNNKKLCCCSYNNAYTAEICREITKENTPTNRCNSSYGTCYATNRWLK